MLQFIYFSSFIVDNTLNHCCRAAVYGGLSGLTIPYLQIQAEGLLTGKFTLHAQTPTPGSGTSTASRIMYKSGTGFKLVDAQSAFTDVLQTFTNSAKFESSAAITPGLRALSDWSGVPFTITIGVPIQMNVAVAFVAQVTATRENQFKAQMGAFAKATSSVGLFVFSKISGTCSASGSSSYLLASYKTICAQVLKDASVSESNTESCTVPSSSGVTGSCSGSYLVITKRVGPTLESGFSSPTLTASNNQKVVFGISFYPM